MAGPIKPIASSAQIDLGLEGNPEQLQRKKPADPGYKEVHEKHNPPEKDRKGKAAENKEFEDKRAKSSPLIAKAEIERMKEALDKSSKSGGGGGGSGGAGGVKSMKYEPVKYAKGGKVNASSRADGIAQRGKTRGRIV
jgi:hypothetical protein